jgi:hypothetical protein
MRTGLLLWVLLATGACRTPSLVLPVGSVRRAESDRSYPLETPPATLRIVRAAADPSVLRERQFEVSFRWDEEPPPGALGPGISCDVVVRIDEGAPMRRGFRLTLGDNDDGLHNLARCRVRRRRAQGDPVSGALVETYEATDVQLLPGSWVELAEVPEGDAEGSLGINLDLALREGSEGATQHRRGSARFPLRVERRTDAPPALPSR